jgi:hypothetical protein
MNKQNNKKRNNATILKNNVKKRKLTLKQIYEHVDQNKRLNEITLKDVKYELNEIENLFNVDISNDVSLNDDISNDVPLNDDKICLFTILKENNNVNAVGNNVGNTVGDIDFNKTLSCVKNDKTEKLNLNQKIEMYYKLYRYLTSVCYILKQNVKTNDDIIKYNIELYTLKEIYNIICNLKIKYKIIYRITYNITHYNKRDIRKNIKFRVPYKLCSDIFTYFQSNLQKCEFEKYTKNKYENTQYYLKMLNDLEAQIKDNYNSNKLKSYILNTTCNLSNEKKNDELYFHGVFHKNIKMLQIYELNFINKCKNTKNVKNVKSMTFYEKILFIEQFTYVRKNNDDLHYGKLQNNDDLHYGKLQNNDDLHYGKLQNYHVLQNNNGSQNNDRLQNNDVLQNNFCDKMLIEHIKEKQMKELNKKLLNLKSNFKNKTRSKTKILKMSSTFNLNNKINKLNNKIDKFFSREYTLQHFNFSTKYTY